MAAPIPFDAPVTTATLPVSFFVFIIVFSVPGFGLFDFLIFNITYYAGFVTLLLPTALDRWSS